MPTYTVKQTRFRPVTAGFRDEPHIPIISVRMEIKDAGCATSHAHPRGQLIYASHGIARVITDFGTWLIPPTQAI